MNNTDSIVWSAYLKKQFSPVNDKRYLLTDDYKSGILINYPELTDIINGVFICYQKDKNLYAMQSTNIGNKFTLEMKSFEFRVIEKL